MPKEMAEEVFFDILSYFSTTMTYKNEPYNSQSNSQENGKYVPLVQLYPLTPKIYGCFNHTTIYISRENNLWW
jgi:hypothetical protein